MSSPLTQI